MLELNMNIVWNFLNFIVLYLLLKKFLFKPVFAIMNQREEDIKNQYALADNDRTEALKLKEQYTSSIENVEKEAEKLIESAQKTADKKADEILYKAQKDAEKLKMDTQKKMQADYQRAQNDLQAKAIDIALAAALKVTEKTADETVNKKLTQEWIKETGDLL